jgi:Zn finger protein HypA/HybF involved in hydrogenase expression
MTDTYRQTTGHEARQKLYAMYVFRCMVCAQEWPSDGKTQPCPKCREWTKQEIVGFPK